MERQFVGIWIPRDLYLDQKLSWTQKILISEIESLSKTDGCWASNEYLAQFLQVTPDTLKNMLTELVKLGYITKEGRGADRVLRVAKSEPQLELIQVVPVEKDTEKEEAFPASKVIEMFNECCPELTKLKFIAGKRLAAAKARYKDLGSSLDELRELFERVHRSDFLCGRTSGDRKFTASFDWIIAPTNFQKIVEGKYDNREGSAPKKKEEPKKSRFSVEGF